jgi:hypothetical protein
VSIQSTHHSRSLQLRQGFAITGAFGEHLVPQSPDLGMIPALGRESVQVAPGQVAKDPLIDAAKLVGTMQAQDPASWLLGLGGFSSVSMHDHLGEPELVTRRSIRNRPIDSLLVFDMVPFEFFAALRLCVRS